MLYQALRSSSSESDGTLAEMGRSSGLDVTTTAKKDLDLFGDCFNEFDIYILFFCVGVVYSGEYDVCDVTLSVYPHRASLKNMPGHGGNRTYDLWNTSPMLCQLSYAVRTVRLT